MKKSRIGDKKEGKKNSNFFKGKIGFYQKHVILILKKVFLSWPKFTLLFGIKKNF